MKHTKGPWSIDPRLPGRVLNAEGEKICDISGATDGAPIATARLIAAAPDLADALRQIIAQCPNPKLPYGMNVCEIARAALAKAGMEVEG